MHFDTYNVRTIQVLIDRDAIMTGAAAGGVQPWKYYDLARATAATTSSQSAPTASPVPAARSTCPRTPPGASC